MSDTRYTLEELYRKGFINASVINYKNIINKVDQMKATGMNKSSAVKYVADMQKITIQTVYKALKLRTSF